jgi:hypothetical protein
MPSKKYYELYKQNPEYVEKEKQRKNAISRNKYTENEEYREKRKEYQRNYNRTRRGNHLIVSANQSLSLDTLTK